MSASRPPIPPETGKKIMLANNSRCCICYQEDVIIHHIDQDSTNNADGNLAVVCLHHHGIAHAKFKLSRNLTQALLKEYKKRWEDRVTKGNLPRMVTDVTAEFEARTRERNATALRIVLAEELKVAYELALYRYKDQTGDGRPAASKMYSEGTIKTQWVTLPSGRWERVTEYGSLQEYVDILVRTYREIEIYNHKIRTPAKWTGTQLMTINLKVGKAIAMSLNSLLISLEHEPKDTFADFAHKGYDAEFPG